ncbi:hypothetical protein FKM82_029208 [Ascaphus truei]
MQDLMTSMLDKLHSSIQNDLKAAVTELRQDITGLTERTSALETKMEETLQAQTAAEDEIFRLGLEVSSLKDSLEDQENRDRQQNIRIRGSCDPIAEGERHSVSSL